MDTSLEPTWRLIEAIHPLAVQKDSAGDLTSLYTAESGINSHGFVSWTRQRTADRLWFNSPASEVVSRYYRELYALVHGYTPEEFSSAQVSISDAHQTLQKLAITYHLTEGEKTLLELFDRKTSRLREEDFYAWALALGMQDRWSRDLFTSPKVALTHYQEALDWLIERLVQDESDRLPL